MSVAVTTVPAKENRMKPYVLGPRLPLFSPKRKDFHPAMRAFHAKQARKERS